MTNRISKNNDLPSTPAELFLTEEFEDRHWVGHTLWHLLQVLHGVCSETIHLDTIKVVFLRPDEFESYIVQKNWRYKFAVISKREMLEFDTIITYMLGRDLLRPYIDATPYDGADMLNETCAWDSVMRPAVLRMMN